MLKVSADFSGLERLQRNLSEMEGTHTVSFDDLFPPEFMREHTDFGSIDDMFQASGFKVNGAEDFDAIPDDEWDAFVVRTTRFGSWEEMKEEATGRWATSKLGL